MSLINQNETATANNGNLIQAIPLPIEVSTKIDKQAEIIDKIENIIASLIQIILNHFHENLKIEKLMNETPIITIHKSAKDLLIIIRKGIIDQMKIKKLLKMGLFFNNKKYFCVISFRLKAFKL